MACRFPFAPALCAQRLCRHLLNALSAVAATAEVHSGSGWGGGWAGGWGLAGPRPPPMCLPSLPEDLRDGLEQAALQLGECLQEMAAMVHGRAAADRWATHLHTKLAPVQ